MKNFQLHFNEKITNLSKCWLLTLRDGISLGFTDYDNNLLIEGVMYYCNTGLSSEDLNLTLNSTINNMEIRGFLNSNLILESDLISGRYDGASIEIFMVNHDFPNDGKIILHSGHLGKISFSENIFHAEIIGIGAALKQSIGDIYSPLCRAQFCDKKCKLNISNFSKISTVSNVLDSQSYIDESLKEPDGYYQYGSIKSISGLNTNQVTEIKSYKKKVIKIFQSMPFDIRIGDQFIITAGCDKNFKTCTTKFQNSSNFRGEPNIPGVESLFFN